MRQLAAIYSYRFPSVIVYMLQSTEYQANNYIKWLWRTRDFSKVEHRRQLERTKYAKMLLIGLAVGMLMEIMAGIVLIAIGLIFNIPGAWAFGLAVIIAYPIVWSHLIILPLEMGRLYIVEPKQQREINQSEAIFALHPAAKIAVAGSYGKTTMKEVLRTVLAEGKQVAATEANHNVAIEHAKFAKRLSGNEEVLIVEYGEGAPGDVSKFTAITKPTHAVITGLAPAHLDRYKTLAAAGKDIFSLAHYLKGKNVYVNIDSSASLNYMTKQYNGYGRKGVGEWKASDVVTDINGLSFDLSNGRVVLGLKTKLLGRYQVGVISAAAVLGLELGLSEAEVIRGIAKTKPFEHRMQPYELNGAWIIDDTYNGNIDGIKAGCELLAELRARRKIYVSPGLVDQGIETQSVHEIMGRTIAKAKPDIVVLMVNSTTNYIKQGLSQEGFVGELKLETNPLAFYHNLEHFIAAGDVVLMQNDWPDNYA